MAVQSICSVAKCSNPTLARGWCRKHYQRWYKHRDPLETNGTERGSPMTFLQTVVLTYRGNDCLPWPFATDQNGYGKIRYDGRSQRVNGVVCAMIHGSPPTPRHEVAHSCGNGTLGCCAPRHLSWKTHAENEADKLVHGTLRTGEDHGRSRFTNEQIRAIRSLSGVRLQREIADQFATSQGQISAIINRRIYASVD